MSDLQQRLNDDIIVSDLRPYLGLSGVGNKCYRALQYQHYWAYTDSYSTRVERLFNVGHAAELVMIADLEKHGLSVHSEQTEVIGFAGHWKGHIDGVVDDDMLWEAKTHNDKSFADLKRKKVKESKPVHYAQMQSYMGYMELPEAMYMALNKNNSEYHIEFVSFDPDYFVDLKAKCADIVTTDVLFKRIGNNKISWFECKFCNAKDVCFGLETVNKSCRSCKHVDVVDKGGWECGKDGSALSVDQQKAACDSYELSEMFK